MCLKGGLLLKQKFSVDRIECGIAVCYDENEKKYEFSATLIGLERGALFEADLVNGVPTNVVYLEEETAAIKKQMKQRLDNLFGRHSK